MNLWFRVEFTIEVRNVGFLGYEGTERVQVSRREWSPVLSIAGKANEISIDQCI